MAATAIEPDKKVQKRLAGELIMWLTTVGSNRKPHAVPVWFWWDGSSFLIYSIPGQKVRDIEANPNVELHFNTDRSGDLVHRFEGVAEVLADQPPANRVPKYLAKYRERIKGYGWTPKSFADQYRVAIRVRPTRLRA